MHRLCLVPIPSPLFLSGPDTSSKAFIGGGNQDFRRGPLLMKYEDVQLDDLYLNF